MNGGVGGRGGGRTSRVVVGTCSWREGRGWGERRDRRGRREWEGEGGEGRGGDMEDAVYVHTYVV